MTKDKAIAKKYMKTNVSSSAFSRRQTKMPKSARKIRTLLKKKLMLNCMENASSNIYSLFASFIFRELEQLLCSFHLIYSIICCQKNFNFCGSFPIEIRINIVISIPLEKILNVFSNYTYASIFVIMYLFSINLS